MPEDISAELTKFFEYIWQDTQGYVYAPTINGPSSQFTKYMFEWPRQKKGIVRHVIQQNGLGNDVYYAPSLFSEPKPDKQYVLGTHVLWVDFDGKAPESWPDTAKKFNIPEPTMTLQSSVSGREHAYWKLANFLPDIETIDSRNRALAYTLGADSGGWDADQILRPPGTTNYGYGIRGKRKDWFTGDTPIVRITRETNEHVNPNVFNPLGTPENIIANKIELGNLPGLSEVFMLGRWPDDFRTLFNLSKDEIGSDPTRDRSGSLQRLGYYGAENGFTDEQIFVILQDADSRWEKYYNRHNRNKAYLDIIARARAKHGYVDYDTLEFAGLASSASVITNSKLVYDFEEFMDLEINIDWLLEGILRQEGVGVITGPPGVGKTQFAIQLGTSLALGENFLRWENKSGSPKKVLVLSLEMGVIPLKIFWQPIARSYSKVMRELKRNFNVSPLGEGIPLDRAEGQAFLDKMLEQYQPDVVIIDSLQKITSKELSDELAIKAMLEFLDKARLKHHCAMIFIHHNRKKGQGDSATGGMLDDMYGSRYIAANVDFVINLHTSMKDLITVSEWKNRLGPQGAQFDVIRNANLFFTPSTDQVVFEGFINDSNGRAEGGSSVEGNEPTSMGLFGSF